MKNKGTHTFLLLIPILIGIALPLAAQQTDTTRTEKELKEEQKTFSQPYHSERSTNNFLLSSSGIYGVPEPTEYYTPPFTGQKSLDYAVEVYREGLKNNIANTPLFQFISRIAPFVTNRFEFGIYRIYDLPIVDRDHPLLYPQVGNEEQE